MKTAACLGVVLATAAFPLTAAEHTVEVRDNFFQPAQLTIEPGDTVRWVNRGNNAHNVNADDNSFRCAEGCDPASKSYHGGGGGGGSPGDPSSASWQVTKTFDQEGEIGYHCDNHRLQGMTGTILVQKQEEEQEQGEPAMPPNFGHTGSWFNPATDGQGFSIEVVVREGEPSDVVVYWFTFNEAGEMAATANKQGVVDDHRWYIATGELPAQDNVVDLTVFISSGGEFDTEPPPAPSQEAAGTGTLAFSSCTEGVLTYDIELRNQDAQQVSGEIPIQRLTPDVRCQELAGN